MPDEPLIVLVIHKYHPDWRPPRNYGREWESCRCPWHGDSRPSASVSYRHNAFTCFACGMKGDAIGIIRREEGKSYNQAVRIAEELSPGGNNKVPGKPARKSRRRTFEG